MPIRLMKCNKSGDLEITLDVYLRIFTNLTKY